jgi:hypothetical protein
VTLLTAWVVAPILLGALALGCGLLLEAAGGVVLQRALLAPAGLALLIIAAQFTTLSDPTAELTAPLVVGLAVAGFALAPLERLRSLWGWGLLLPVGVFVVFAAPIVLSGHATWAGYQRLNDTAIWLGLTDRVMEHGRHISDLPPSGYKTLLDTYIGHGYPVGSFFPPGIGHMILGQDLAWLFQPSIAFVASMLALALYALTQPLVESRLVRAIVAFFAAQPAILFGYSLWGGIKELSAAWILVTLAALLVPMLRVRGAPRSLVSVAVVSAATLAILSGGGALWITAPLVGALVLLVVATEPRLALQRAGIFLVVMVVLSIPAIVLSGSFLSAGKDSLTSGNALGALIKPFSPLRVLGIWPTRDLRLDATNETLNNILLVLLQLAIIGGLALAWMRRAWGPLLYFGGAAVGCLVTAAFGSPWVDGKGYAIASPAAISFGLLGALAIGMEPLDWMGVSRRIRFPIGVAVGALLVAGVIWSNFLGYRGVNLAPRDRFAELSHIGSLVAGKGPTFTPDGEPYGEWHFLRDGATDRNFTDLDRLRIGLLMQYRTIVMRRSPLASRPPSAYALVYRGHFYEVWRRPLRPTRRPVEHLGLGSRSQITGTAPCSEVLGLARRAGARGMLAAVRRAPSVILQQAPGTTPKQAGDVVVYLDPTKAGTFETSVATPSAGRYGVWLGGSFRRELELLVDGKEVSTKRNRINVVGQYELMGIMGLGKGAHRVAFRYGAADLHPGSDGTPFALGPLILSTSTDDAPVTYVKPAAAKSLCGKDLDWVEALKS